MSPGQAPARGLKESLSAFLSADDEQTGDELADALTVVLSSVLVATNLVGTAAVLALIYLVLPIPPLADPAHARAVNALVAAGYIVVAVVVGALAGRRQLSSLSDWLRSERPADVRIRRQVVGGRRTGQRHSAQARHHRAGGNRHRVHT